MAKVEFTWVFESTKLEKDQERRSIRALFRTGGYGRKTMRSSSVMPVSKKTQSRPNSGKVHVRYAGSPMRKLVSFDVDRRRRSVSVGTALFGERADRTFPPVPKLLDEGGIAKRRIRQDRRRKLRPGQIAKVTVRTSFRYRPRNYIGNAYRRTLPFFNQAMKE